MKQTLQQFLQKSLVGQTIKVCYWLGNFDGPYQRKYLKKGEIAIIKTYEPNESLINIFTAKWDNREITNVGVFPNDEQLLITLDNGFTMIANLTDEIDFVDGNSIS